MFEHISCCDAYLIISRDDTKMHFLGSRDLITFVKIILKLLIIRLKQMKLKKKAAFFETLAKENSQIPESTVENVEKVLSNKRNPVKWVLCGEHFVHLSREQFLFTYYVTKCSHNRFLITVTIYCQRLSLSHTHLKGQSNTTKLHHRN
ncbi:hypothetical protein BpHYR1_043459 [Brachionus plicatilis]|uniref:Uncharacterized protein n=1 Tax=Brachionus plicatilis TaxID=10195 RepID=A0A3M7RNF5_BRAPC|nr:hypothetical protein BpHYR1_043459 [Brachionus plicatilis]